MSKAPNFYQTKFAVKQYRPLKNQLKTKTKHSVYHQQKVHSDADRGRWSKTSWYFSFLIDHFWCLTALSKHWTWDWKKWLFLRKQWLRNPIRLEKDYEFLRNRAKNAKDCEQCHPRILDKTSANQTEHGWNRSQEPFTILRWARSQTCACSGKTLHHPSDERRKTGKS